MVTDHAGKVRENRLRETAKRQGYGLMKSRRRDPRAIGYGGYMIFDPNTNGIVAGGTPHEFSLDLDHVERWLVGDQINRDLAREGWRHSRAE